MGGEVDADSTVNFYTEGATVYAAAHSRGVSEGLQLPRSDGFGGMTRAINGHEGKSEE